MYLYILYTRISLHNSFFFMAFPGLWGFMVWDLLHWMAEILYVSPSLLDDWKKAMLSIVLTLPCPACKYHATIYITTHKLSVIKSAQTARSYTLQFHNAVSQRVGKPAWSLQMYLNKYQLVRNQASRVSAKSICLYLLLVAQSLHETKDLHIDLKTTLQKGFGSILKIYKRVYPAYNIPSLPSSQTTYNRETLTRYVISLRDILGLEHMSKSNLEENFRRTYFTTPKLKVVQSYYQRMKNSDRTVYIPRF